MHGYSEKGIRSHKSQTGKTNSNKERESGGEGNCGISLFPNSDSSCSTRASWERKGLTEGQNSRVESQRKAWRLRSSETVRVWETGKETELNWQRGGERERGGTDIQWATTKPAGIYDSHHPKQSCSRWSMLVLKLSSVKKNKKTAAIYKQKAQISLLWSQLMLNFLLWHFLKTWGMCFLFHLCFSGVHNATFSQCFVCIFGSVKLKSSFRWCILLATSKSFLDSRNESWRHRGTAAAETDTVQM